MSDVKYLVKGVNAKLQGYGCFQYPWRGDVAAPDWDSKPECGGGIHGIDYEHYLYNISNAVYLILRYTGDCVAIGNDKIKVLSGTVCYLSKHIRNIQAWLERHGVKYRGYRATLTGGDRATLTGGDRAKLTGGDRATLTGGDEATLTGGYRATLTGGYRATLIINGNTGTVTGKNVVVVMRGYGSGDYHIAHTMIKDGTYKVELCLTKNGKATIRKTSEEQLR